MTASCTTTEAFTIKPGASGDNTPIDLAGKRLHFVGIGGCGMSALARIASYFGATCGGSDLTTSATTEQLVADGIPVDLTQTGESVPDDCDLLVISAAIRYNHPEVVEATRRGLTVLKYAQLLGQLMLGRIGVAIAGTHGKSTTTSMLAHLLIKTGLDPSFIVGAHCDQIGGGARFGHSNLLVAEACEFDRSFHSFHPTHAVILNVEEDHMEIYGSLDAVVESFAQFARQLPANGSLLLNHEMPHRLAIIAGLDCTVESIGFSPQADWRIEIDEPTHSPFMAIRLYHGGQQASSLSCQMPGEHMAYNAAAAAITAHRLGAPWDAIQEAISEFRGLDRRMQWLGERPVDGGCVTVVDDYGHHPTEIDTTLRALRLRYNPNRLICVFQPHQHSRTRFLMEQFAVSFSQADIIIVPHIHFARDSEQERHAVRAADLVDRLRHRGHQAMHLYPFDAIVEELQVILHPGDLVVTMGAGNVWKVAHDLLRS